MIKWRFATRNKFISIHIFWICTHFLYFIKLNTIKFVFTNFGTPGGTSLPLISHFHQQQLKQIQMENKASSAALNITLENIGVITRGKAMQLEEIFKPASAMEEHSTASYYLEAPVMVTNASTLEEQVASIAKLLESMNKRTLEQDAKISKLILEKGEGSRVNDEKDEKSDDSESFEKHHEEKTPPKNIEVSADGFIHINQLKDFIMGTVKDKFEGTSKSAWTYSKPYTTRIDSLKMPIGYQPPKFQQFDGKGNPKQHVAHFMETCNDAGTYGDYLVKQFVRSLKDNAFDWYVNLEPNSIDSWGQMQKEFLNRFYSTRRTVSIVELTNSKQWKEESVIDYINRWRDLSLNCKDQLSEASAIEMCIQGMHWSLQYILKGIRPNTFEELTTRARDMELSMIANKVDDLHMQMSDDYQEN
ncbi:uncharacterized protein LOC131021637 [Salvia miltiorrhiza]|uniref:uncharacterized protein LOC131021637 n=1 Tax=Salvia miltiorrhiza TaxID=226208 RepID=UPI0025AC1415|nr:uncharacterized protein LOC131021637 [Salvia miltiorrhiza]XP_057806885.1 uncharacterized protein LOC131021637 [Salvia miltiorrhiza]XP_057806889.1 uncharacterized protein LOC131021637 [Salvia miltiorrhiza]